MSPKRRSLPAEWAPQAGVMLAWPHVRTDWADSLPAIERTYACIAREIAAREIVLIVCHDVAERDHVRARLRAAGVDPNRTRCAVAPFNDTWIRDFGPLTVVAGRKPTLLDFDFDAWGGKYPASLDDAVTRRLHAAGVFGEVDIDSPRLVLEGGSIDVDGAGALLTTSRCLLTNTRNRGLGREALEQRLRELFGIERTLWLEHGHICGDDTDSHVDMLARFCDAHTIAYSTCDDPADEHYPALQAMTEELRAFRTTVGTPYRLIPLPIPQPIFDRTGKRLPASYANFLIINGAVLLPVYGDPADRNAVARLEPAFPGREIVTVDCTALIQQYGSLHCATMQLPEGLIINDASGTGTARERR